MTKTLHYTKKPKKTWELLKEATNLTKSSDKIENLNINYNLVNDPELIANEFKGTVSRDFFALAFFLNLFILVLLEMP